ncbi:MAG: nucleotide pyrophosphohydrolase [Candidatus Taylorbacteria bacterium]|nr:nucleotide pyrophosphohydrolase [Candidatus Taylorbacteria bacterium]
MNTEELVEQFVKDRDWHKQMPDHVAKSIAIEASELLEHFQWSNPTANAVKKDAKKLDEVSGELADVFIYCFQMAVLLGLDVDTIVSEKLMLAGKKYPVSLMKKRSAGEPDAHERYLSIKKSYRAKKKNG